MVVDSASKIAKKFGLSDLIIGLTVVAIATSAPEFAVSVSAALKNQHSISVGNIVGSNIFNLGFILGFIAIIRPIEITKDILKRDGLFLLFTGLLLTYFFSNYILSSLEGSILFSLLVLYIIWLLFQKKGIEEELSVDRFSFWDIPKFLIGISMIIISANYLVESASIIARIFGVTEWLIGITIVGAGTSLPEFATSLVALKKRKIGISAGNLIGSDIFNMLGVLGISSIINPLSIKENELLGLVLLSLALVILLIFMRSGWKISRTEGVFLIMIAIIRWSVDLFI